MDKKDKKRDKKEKKEDKKATVVAAPPPSMKERNVIIMDGSTYHECVAVPSRMLCPIIWRGGAVVNARHWAADRIDSWMALWRGHTLADGTPLRIVQASWIETSVTHYSDSSGALRCR